MPVFSPPERADVRLAAEADEAEARPREAGRRRYLILGDFSGRGSRGIVEADALGVGRRTIAVDLDDLDAAMSRVSVEVSVPLPDRGSAAFRPRSLEDFHPDRIFEREPAFGDLRTLRRQLEDPARFRDAVETIASWGGAPASAPDPEAPPAREAAPAAGLLENMLELEPGSKENARPPTADRDLDAFVRGIVQPHLLRGEPANQDLWTARVDAAISARMRAILHDASFQGVEAAWRGLDFLLRRIEGDARVEVLDVTKEELAEGAKSVRDLSDWGLHPLLVGSAGEDSDSIYRAVTGLYEFAPTVDDVALLARLGRIAAAARAPFLAGAAPALLAAESFAVAPDPTRWERARGTPPEELWSALRQMPEARFLGLAAPRFLLRLPYGEATDPTERFPFEECEGVPAHEEYLWGNSALLGLALLEEPGVVTGLPLHVREVDGETRIQPCAETLLPAAVMEAMLERGIMPVVAMRDRDVLRVPRLQSVSDPPTRLPGAG